MTSTVQDSSKIPQQKLTTFDCSFHGKFDSFGLLGRKMDKVIHSVLPKQHSHHVSSYPGVLSIQEL